MILMYHKVAPEAPTVWWVEVDEFHRHMCELRGRRVVHLAEYDPDDPMQAVITFDGVYENVLTYAAPLMARFGYPFELFVSGDHVGAGNEFDAGEPPAPFADENHLRRLVELGGRLQWHGRSHRDLTALEDRTAIVEELEVPDRLRSIDPRGFRYVAYPYGRFDSRTIEEALRRFDGGLSCDQGDGRSRFEWNRLTVTNATRLADRKVSVIVPSFNYGCFLSEAVESVLRQTLPPDEVLIVDDASSDDTARIGEQLAAESDGRVRFLRNSSNLGIVRNFNQAIGEVSGDYVMFLGADNRLLANYVESCTRVLDESPDVAIAYTDMALFGPRAAEVYSDVFPTDWHGGARDGFWLVVMPEPSREEAAQIMMSRGFVHGSSMYRRVVFEEVGGYIDKSLLPEDYDLFGRMIRRGYGARKAAGTLLEYRQHSRDQANVRLTSAMHLAFYQRRLAEAEAELEALRRSRSWLWTEPARRGSSVWRSVRQKRRAEGWKALTKAVLRRLIP